MNNGFYEFSRGKQETTSSVFPYTGSAIISGSLEITGSLEVTQGITGSLFGTASFAVSSSRAVSSSFAVNSTSASFAVSSSFASTASIVLTPPTLQEVLDNNHDLVDGIFNAGTGAGNSNTGISQVAIGTNAGGLNSGNDQNAFGSYAGYANQGENQNAFGAGAGSNNTGNNVNAFGVGAGDSNTFDNVNLFGSRAQATANGQTVLSKDGTIMARINTSGLTASRQYDLQNNSGTIAFTGDIPTNTSDLVNDGENGTSPYVTADQLPSNLNLFATNVSSDIATYFKLVTSIDDPDYNDTAVDIPTGAITTTGQFIAALATTANVLVGNPGIINLLTIGNVRRTSGTGTAEFYYEVYHRDSTGTETLIATSNNTPPVSAAIYTEFLAAALLNNGVFLATDRIVVKYYADRIAGGSNPEYEFQFGGTSPVRTTFPVPASNIPLDATPTSGSTNGVQSGGVFDALALKANTTVATTGVDIFFVTPQIYNTSSSPATASITNDLTGANLGVIQKIYHNHSVAPTVPGGWVLIGGEYVVSDLNIIYAEWCGSSRVEYWIAQEQ